MAMPPATGWTLFDTALGTCAIAWGPRGILAVQLPEADVATTQARLWRSVQPLGKLQPQSQSQSQSQLQSQSQSQSQSQKSQQLPPQARPPPAVAEAVHAITELLAGRPHDFSRVVLDMGGATPFQQRVYALALRIPAGQTQSYGQLAEALGGRHLARAVGQALGRNPFAPIVPCHRVLAAHGRAGGFSAHGGSATKLRMLATEGWRPACTGVTAPLFEG